MGEIWLLPTIIVMKIPGLSFSWKRALGVTAMKQKVARATGIPTRVGSLVGQEA